jgi:hypothetical protein
MDSAVVFQDDKPVLELSAEEFVFPIRTPDERHIVRFHMKPYRSYAVKSFYDDLMPRRKSISRGERVIEVPDPSRIKSFVDAHFVRMEGVSVNGEEPGVDIQRRWLNDNEAFMVKVFRQGYDAISTPDFAETNGHRPLELFGPEQHEIPSQWTLNNNGIDHRLIVTHITSRLTKVDHEKYQKAIRLMENGRESYVQANWDVVEQIYDQKAKSLEGAVIGGEPCNEANIKEWVPLVPFCMKVFVMGQVAQELETKNG